MIWVSSIGGRNGKAVKVTNLIVNRPGSLQSTCEEKGPRIIVFDVAGIIRGDIKIKHLYITNGG